MEISETLTGLDQNWIFEQRSLFIKYCCAYLYTFIKLHRLHSKIHLRNLINNNT